MLVRCPSCGHSRTINPDKVPPRAEFATCPKCSHRFRFRTLEAAPVAPETNRPAGTGGTDGPGGTGGALPLPNPEEHKDIWDAVDSLRERWTGVRKDGQKDRKDESDDALSKNDDAGTPPRDLGRLSDDGADDEPGGASGGAGGTGGAFYDGNGADRRDDADIFIPWEQPREMGYAASLYRTLLMALLHPGRFFAALTGQPPLTQALLFYLVFGLLQTSANMLWWHMAINSSMGPVLAQRLGPEILRALDISQLPFMLLTSPLVLSLYLFIMAGIIHMMVRLVEPDKASFMKTFKVAGYSAAALVFSLVPFLGFIIAPLCFLTVLLTGCRYAFRLSWTRAMLVLTPPCILFLLLSAGQTSVGV